MGEFYSIAITNNYQKADTGTKMIHLGKNTKSKIISKGISAGKADNTYRGLVDINSKAINARNYTQCDSLLIGNKCGAHTIPYIKNILEGMKIPILEQEGIAADDIIGTVAKKAEKKNFKVFMVTPDKDFSQLVSENIFLCKPARMGNGMEIWGTKEVNEKFEVNSPEQVIDFLGMMGDSVDNIPGLPGVGEKTAKKFLKEYGSLENLLSNSHLIPGKLGEKITNNKELGIISKELAKIILDVPIDYNLKDFKLTEPDKGKVIEVFNELEFRRIKETFFKIYGTEVQTDNSVNQPISIQTDLFDQTQYTGVTDKKTNSNSSRS